MPKLDVQEYRRYMLETIFTHDDINIIELAQRTGEPGSVEAQAAVIELANANIRELVRYGYAAVMARAEAYGLDAKAARWSAVFKHIDLMLQEMDEFKVVTGIQETGPIN